MIFHKFSSVCQSLVKNIPRTLIITKKILLILFYSYQSDYDDELVTEQTHQRIQLHKMRNCHTLKIRGTDFSFESIKYDI